MTITLMDTTLRDGEQTQGVSFAPAEKLSLAQALLGRLKVDRIEIASAGVSSGEQDAVRAINKWAKDNGHLHKVEVLGFVDHTRSVDWIKQAGGEVINLLTKGSENHCLKQLRKSPAEHIEMIKATVDYARPERAAGTTKWSLRKLWSLALDGITSTSTLPLRIWTYLGATIAFLAFIYAAFLIG